MQHLEERGGEWAVLAHRIESLVERSFGAKLSVLDALGMRLSDVTDVRWLDGTSYSGQGRRCEGGNGEGCSGEGCSPARAARAGPAVGRGGGSGPSRWRMRAVEGNHARTLAVRPLGAFSRGCFGNLRPPGEEVLKISGFSA